MPVSNPIVKFLYCIVRIVMLNMGYFSLKILSRFRALRIASPNLTSRSIDSAH